MAFMRHTPIQVLAKQRQMQQKQHFYGIPIMLLFLLTAMMLHVLKLTIQSIAGIMWYRRYCIGKIAQLSGLEYLTRLK
ncbi:hypothetical protein PI91_16575 [Enterobacter sp. FB]|nr:hypothetical protein PI91_16575 [Enterobacter sp. FB]KJP82629.1 hypothetical protein SR65_09035 [Enterobacter roggenkampii]KKA54320.1 hypothetical protein UP01_22145 [Enterobacter roggenkampii]KLP38704.1 hypothetical protein ABF66_08285 [Enterobacter roggenkampii]OIR50253.1 hypothetical protein BH716_16780 [Lelliottia nimipressuralis]